MVLLLKWEREIYQFGDVNEDKNFKIDGKYWLLPITS